MRFNTTLFSAANQANSRRPQKDPVPFQMLLPLELGKTVSGKGDKLKEAVCMQEMAVMFACFKKTEFNQQECLNEVASFQTCFNNYNDKMKLSREQGRKGILVPGEKTLTHRQLNKLLRRFPPKK
ncbi:unnamed protein product [Diatraea saccharalis]|uniref:Coiled-coil-helix-coiled-coil-helix domain-containing protein 1 n=1 Tax=Diatraea saccharalis TaxID=40085 RepID=A0A9N9RFF6_9NEOP|nr:unnamed protein product [Diatraea saccharalis]